MQYFLLILRLVFDDLRRNPLRTILTSLGIFIGISSVVLLSALGLGLKKYIEEQFRSMGSNLVMVLPGKSLENAFRMQTSIMSGGAFDERDVKSLSKVRNISGVIPAFATYGEIEALGKSEVYETLASTPEIFSMLNFAIEEGSLFTANDVVKGKKVVVLGYKPAEKLFGSATAAIGKTVKIEHQAYRVIGVLEAKGGGDLGGSGIDDHVFMPHTAALSFNPNKKFISLYMRASDITQLEQVKKDVKSILLKRYNDSDFTVADEQELMNIFSQIFSMVNLLLVGIATISLIVGGVGVMNIMYVSVVERVEEIGIRRAVGAKKNDILNLFLCEAIGVSVLGGVLALLVSYAAVLAVQQFFPAYIDLTSVTLALGVSTGIGLIFGVWPAVQAANLLPIEAIRKY